MKIQCPDCSTSYDIKPEVLGGDGRSVKCVRCGNRWFVRPKDAADEGDDGDGVANVAPDGEDAQNTADEAEWAADEAEEERSAENTDPAPDPEPEPAPTADKTAAEPSPSEFEADDAPGGETDDDGQPVDIETLAKRPKINVNPNKFKRNHFGAVSNWLARRNYRRIGGVVLFGVALTACVFVVLIRDSIVKQAPDLASLFETIGFEVNLRGLEFRDLRTFSEVESGKQVLVVEGSIRNIGEENARVPAVRLSIRGTDLQEIYAWTVEPRTTTLKGLDETRFRTILSDPPAGASDIHVRFIDRGQRQVILE